MTTSDELLSQLSEFKDPNTIILGIGNTLKGDDGVGPFICQQISGQICAEVIDAFTVPENYIGVIIKKAPDNLLVIDAIDFEAKPGTIKIFAPDALDTISLSTHCISPRLFVDMICQDVNTKVSFIGIQPSDIGMGKPLSDDVNKAANLLVSALTKLYPLS